MKIFLLAFLLPLVAAHTKKTIEAKLTDVPVVQAANAVNSFFQDKEGENALTRTAVHIISATAQTVQGTSYDYKIRFSNGQNFDVCDVNVWERRWLPEDKYKVTINGCTTKSLIGGDDHDLVPHGNSNNSLIGGDDHDLVPHGNSNNGRAGPVGAETEVSLNDPRVQRALGIFTDNVNARSNSMFRQIPTSGSATIQIKNGIVFRFKAVTFSSTSCGNTNQENSGKLSETDCPLKADNGADSLPTCGHVSWLAGVADPVAEITDC